MLLLQVSTLKGITSRLTLKEITNLCSPPHHQKRAVTRILTMTDSVCINCYVSYFVSSRWLHVCFLSMDLLMFMPLLESFLLPACCLLRSLQGYRNKVLHRQKHLLVSAKKPSFWKTASYSYSTSGGWAQHVSTLQPSRCWGRRRKSTCTGLST